GSWSYTLAHDKADGLAADHIVHDHLTVTSVDGTATKDICVTITGTNDAPVLADNDSLHFNSIDYSEGDNEGQTVASLLGSDVTDPDGPGAGIAIIDNEVSSQLFGKWQYKLDGGGDWTDFDASASSALLLGTNDHVRFEPTAG